MLGILGFLIMIIIIVLLLKNVTIPSVAFIVVPTMIALLAGFSVVEVGKFVEKGVAETALIAALFIFSISYFGIVSDAGMFDRVINALAKRAGDNVVAVCVLAALIAMVGHLDGSGAATFLITIPAMLPVFQRLRIRASSLLLIATAAMGAMNLVPWGGPTMRAATVIKMDANDLWHKIIPMQIVGLVLALVVAYLVGKMEQRRGAGPGSSLPPDEGAGDELAHKAEEKQHLARPRLFWFNLALTIGLILMLVFVSIPAFFVFMIGTAVALLVNYPSVKDQGARIYARAKSAIMMASTLLAAGALLGILQESKMMDDMGRLMVGVLPGALGPYLAIIIGVFSVPLALFFSTDAYYFGVLPIIVSVAGQYGVPPVDVAITMVVCRNIACFISPVVPATYLGCGLANVAIKDHIKTSFFWVWGISIVMLVSGLLMGIIRIH